MKGRWRAFLNWALLTAFTAAAGGVAAEDSSTLRATYRGAADRIVAAAASDHSAWNRLAEITDTFGPRLSGSPNLEAALAWAAAEMRRDGLSNVRLEKVMVPRWVRGEEHASLVEPFASPLVMAGLGMSVGTPEGGITAEVLVVGSFEELEARRSEARERIVLFDFPYVSYGANVKFRMAGASAAARCGAKAVLIRSVGSPGLRTAHTGTLLYEADAPAIPAAALSHEDANRLRRISARGQRLVVRLEMHAHREPDAESANLLAEVPGSTKPEEILLLGCHSDSWDLGTGAMDDGSGCVIVWEALHLLKRLDLRPRRTIRVVLFVNEENGTRGGHAYLEAHRDELGRHVLALEADSGAFHPTGFGFSGSDAVRSIVKAAAALLAPIGADTVGRGDGGVDVGPLVRAGAIPELSLSVDTSRYMRFHHTAADTVESQDPDDLAQCVGAVATMAYVIADQPDALPRSPEVSR